MLRYFCARTIYFVAGFCCCIAQCLAAMQLFCLKITGEHGIMFLSPVIVVLNGVKRHCIL